MTKKWRDNPAWQQPLQSTAKSQLKIAWGSTAICLLLSSPLFFVLPGEILGGNYLAAIGLLFPAVGLFMIKWSLGLTQEHRKYGTTKLSLDPYPGSIGGAVGGSIKLPATAGIDSKYTVSLMCIYSYIRRSGDSHQRDEDIVWESSGPATTRPSNEGIDLQFCFDVPEELPESQLADRQYHYWKLVVEGNQEDIPYNRSFELPVFATAQTAKFIDVDTQALANHAAEANVEQALTNPQVAARLSKKFGLNLEVKENWIRLYFQSGRNKSTSLLFLVMGLVFGGILLIPDSYAVPAFIRFVFGFVGFATTLAALYLPLNTLDVRINNKQMLRVRKWLGISLKQQAIEPADIQDIEIKRSSRTTSKNKTITYYHLIGIGKFGKFRFAESIDDRAMLEALEKQIRKFAGLQAAA